MIPVHWLVTNILTLIYACAMMAILLNVELKGLSAKKKWYGSIFFIGIITVNIVGQLRLEYLEYMRLYLMFAQLPVYLLFMILSPYRGVKLFFVLLTTVFFTSPIMVIVIVVKHFFVEFYVAYFICCALMLFFAYKFLRKPFSSILEIAESPVFLLFMGIPLIYYIYSYTLTKYGFMGMVPDKQYLLRQLPLIIVFLSYVLLMRIFKIVSQKAELENIQILTNLQLEAAAKQMEQLRAAEKQAIIYRHDLRHHMVWLYSCITENKLQEALDYVAQTCGEIDRIEVIKYSENEPINLILSYYMDQAEKKDIRMAVEVVVRSFTRFKTVDLCSLLSNSLENAIHGCEKIQDDSQRCIGLRLREKNGKLCVEIQNNYLEDISFKDGRPKACKKGHGVGTKSMVQVVEKYVGICEFTARDGVFTFQATL